MILVIIIAFMTSLTLVDPSAIGSSLEARIYLKENARIGNEYICGLKLFAILWSSDFEKFEIILSLIFATLPFSFKPKLLEK